MFVDLKTQINTFFTDEKRAPPSSMPLTAPEYHPTADEAVDILAAAWKMSRREVARHLMSFNFGDIT